ncbi:MAG: cellulase family glycosylhydrolase [Eubacterium sp.]|nr:cellulase family glycosylhydrolase [Eubacterium sp.]
MNSKKGLWIAIAVMALIIVGLVGYIIGSKGKDSDKVNQETGIAATTEVVEENTIEDLSSEENTEEDSEADETDKKESENEESEKNETDKNETDKNETDKKEANDSDDNPALNADGSKKAVYASIKSANDWKEGKMHVFQYDLDIINKSKEDLGNWEVKVSGFSGADEEITGWNGKFKIDGDQLIVTSEDYNKIIAANSQINIGFQIKFDNEADGESKKAATVYNDGAVVDIVKEEPTTQSSKEKEESKKEKPAEEKGTPLANHGKLSVKGTDIVDKNGDKYQLKGVSTHGLAWFPAYVNKESFQSLRDDWGANLVRLAMYTAESGGYCQDGDKSELKSLVEDGVEYASELGMYVIIDWHILSDNNPQINEDEAITFFDEMSAKFADYDNVLYEICNEPNGGTSWSDVKEYAEKIIPVIRTNDKDAIILVGSPTWSQDVDLAAEDPIENQTNIAYTAHFYAATHKDNIRDKVKKANSKGLCVFISEFSICDASGNGGIDYDSADDWSSLIDDLNLSYCAWSLCNKAETSALIDSNCDKTSGWEEDDLSDAGKWLKNRLSE